MNTRLTPDEIERSLAAVAGWQHTDRTISRQFEFATFSAAIAFVQAVAEVAEAMNHHPDIDIRHRRVRIAVTTHSVAGLTELDFALAGRCDELVGIIE